MHGASHFYGEQAESIWAELHPLGATTRQMSSGRRHDDINEHHADWNKKKELFLSVFFRSSYYLII